MSGDDTTGVVVSHHMYADSAASILFVGEQRQITDV